MPAYDADAYREDLLTLVGGFEFELCEECGHDVEAHIFAPDPLGHPHAWCRSDLDGAYWATLKAQSR